MTQISNKNAWVDFDGSNKTDNNDVNLSTPDPLGLYKKILIKNKFCLY